MNHRPVTHDGEWRSQHFDAIPDRSFAALAAITRGEPNPAPDALRDRTCAYAELRTGSVLESRRWLPNVVETRLP